MRIMLDTNVILDNWYLYALAHYSSESLNRTAGLPYL